MSLCRLFCQQKYFFSWNFFFPACFFTFFSACIALTFLERLQFKITLSNRDKIYYIMSSVFFVKLCICCAAALRHRVYLLNIVRASTEGSEPQTVFKLQYILTWVAGNTCICETSWRRLPTESSATDCRTAEALRGIVQIPLNNPLDRLKRRRGLARVCYRAVLCTVCD